MLVQFMFKNVLSFKEETVIDLSAINAYKEHAYHLLDIGIKEKFLRVGAVYGANASGKSNLYFALYYFQRIIMESFNNVGENEENAIQKYYIPFSFEKKEENTEYQIIVISNGYEYKYGFEFNDECIVSEWIYRKKLETNRNTVILERFGDEVKLGAAVRKECNVYKDQISKETLALSFFNKLKLNTDIFQNIYSAIMDVLVVPPDFYENRDVLKMFLPEVIDREKGKLVEFLGAIDTGITNIDYYKVREEIHFYTIHIGKDGEEYPLALDNESEGTIRSILIYMNARAAVTGDKVMFVDELNIKLHPLLMKFIIDLFYNSHSKAQLLYTTHDTTLMDKKFFRRDQIWFVQKDKFGYSELIPLSDYKVRSDASFEKDYLAGVYGGIPLIKEFSMKEGD